MGASGPATRHAGAVQVGRVEQGVARKDLAQPD
jgi:hypothetical protein